MRALRRDPQPKIKRDPAPSRLAYRMERLWLRPGFRRFVRVGMPLGCVVALGVWYFGDEARQQAIVDQVAEIRSSIETRPEFMVKGMAIDGASETLAGHIREVMPVDLPISSFDLDLEAMRKQVESLDAVQKVEVRVRAGGLLQVNIEERVPAVIWRGPDGLELLDAEGHRVAGLGSRMERSDLPLIAGEGANASVPEALALFKTAEPIKARLTGMVRMSETRWDVVLDRGQRIMLPQNGAGPALDRVIALNDAQELLSRDVARVDIRNAKRPTLRLTEDALGELRALKGIEIKGNTE